MLPYMYSNYVISNFFHVSGDLIVCKTPSYITPGYLQPDSIACYPQARGALRAGASSAASSYRGAVI